jgi:hypothetical protein
MNEPYYTFNNFLRSKFGGKVLKIAVTAGSGCPNKDGTLSTEGCIFCDSYGAGVVSSFGKSVAEQINSYRSRHPERKYIVYFQSFSNTYGSVDRLRDLFYSVLDYRDVIGLAVATRPDCLEDDVLDLLTLLRDRTYLFVELGLQSVHEKSLLFLNRNHSYDDFLLAFDRLKDRGIDTFVHLILGLPGESRGDMLATVNEMNRLRPRGLKFHLFHILRETTLFKIFMENPFKLLDRQEYLELLIYLLERLDPEIVVQRVLGDREKELFYQPEWALQKASFLRMLQEQMLRQNAFQGKRYHG